MSYSFKFFHALCTHKYKVAIHNFHVWRRNFLLLCKVFPSRDYLSNTYRNIMLVKKENKKETPPKSLFYLFNTKYEGRVTTEYPFKSIIHNNIRDFKGLISKAQVIWKRFLAREYHQYKAGKKIKMVLKYLLLQMIIQVSSRTSRFYTRNSVLCIFAMSYLHHQRLSRSNSNQVTVKETWWDQLRKCFFLTSVFLETLVLCYNLCN